jgi:hypothetical protein
MIESKSPIIRELKAEWERRTFRNAIDKLLVIRFGPDAEKIKGQIDTINDDDRLNHPFESAATCPDLNSFRNQL